MEVHPKKSDFHPATSIRSSTELATVTPDCHSKQGKLPLRPPTPDPDQRLQDTSSPSAQPPAPEKSNISHTSAIPANDQPLENRINDILRVFGALIRQLHIIRASLNVSKGEYGKIKTHHHKALMVFCTGRCVGWAKEKSKIERRISSVSRVLREDREWERQIVEKVCLFSSGGCTRLYFHADDHGSWNNWRGSWKGKGIEWTAGGN